MRRRVPNSTAAIAAVAADVATAEEAIDVKADKSGLKLYIRDAQGTPHYWQITVTDLGVVETTDAGASVPSDGIVIYG